MPPATRSPHPRLPAMCPSPLRACPRRGPYPSLPDLATASLAKPNLAVLAAHGVPVGNALGGLAVFEGQAVPGAPLVVVEGGAEAGPLARRFAEAVVEADVGVELAGGVDPPALAVGFAGLHPIPPCAAVPCGGTYIQIITHLPLSGQRR